MQFRNQLLSSLRGPDLSLLQPHLVHVTLEVRHAIQKAGAALESVYFIEEGVSSVVASTPGGVEIEVGLAGREGLIGTSLIYGSTTSSTTTFVQIAGSAYRLDAAIFDRALLNSATFRSLMLRYAMAFNAQIVSAALTNGKAVLEQRLARWLLMCHDRIDGDTIALSHDFLAVMLGVRRSGVTAALHRLEGEHLIRSHRMVIVIRDRQGLQVFANGFYGTAEAEYARLVRAADA
jgi:CRP-like cAMP-binding protein